MMRGVVMALVVGMAALEAQQITPTAPPPLSERPRRLMTAQQLALVAYPELRTQGLQLRVETDTAHSRVTVGFAAKDRGDVLGLSRPREAQLVVDATFDAQEALTAAVLRGPLAHAAERRRIRALPSGWTEALRAEGALYAPDRRADLLRDLDLPTFAKVLGRLTATGAAFQAGSADDGLYWEVAATSATGSPVTLGFDPFAGRLVRVVMGGAQ